MNDAKTISESFKEVKIHKPKAVRVCPKRKIKNSPSSSSTSSSSSEKSQNHFNSEDTKNILTNLDNISIEEINNDFFIYGQNLEEEECHNELLNILNCCPENNETYSDDENSSLLDAEGRSSDDSGSSRDDDAAQEDHFEERNIDELLQKKEITRDIKILSKKIYGNTPNFFNANENEIIIEENYLDIKNPLYNLNESLIDCIINYLESKIITENKFSPKLLIEYISIIKCLIANSKNNKVKDFVTKNITVLKKIVNILINKYHNIHQILNSWWLVLFLIQMAL